ncbi:hypothetical protein CANCADRAFT_44396 [Tortispora caseinolytica NRRL Y-17796]|uniref:Ceramide very long chain fatty acid hydroxylase n=1 Tax=Tortispora caseinolytica NRRL Y-17796 TaxID=767744 RepID=A0A1E4TG83_9ASCO|nr:hypothetical protein CANCADRAFT_44396 [Tortispora caseinolytica NRRL Y-17796]
MAEAKKLPLLTKMEVASHNTDKSVYVTLNNRFVYDVTSFLEDHPGGPEFIMEYAGKDITEVLKNATIHEHSESAYEMLEEYLVAFQATAEEEDQLINEPGLSIEDRGFYSSTGLYSAEDLSIQTDFENDYKASKFLDLSKPLFTQVLFGKFTKEFYLDQVHKPRHYGQGSAPFFGNFLEPFSQTPWWVVPMIWIPADLYGVSIALRGLSLPVFIFFFSLGLFIWTLVEYILHRFLFHLDYYLPDHPLAFTLHFTLHGVHHYLPMDKLRLVMPPALFIMLATPFYKLAHTLFPYYPAMAVFTGGILGYICYDCTHYFLHHVNLPTFFQELKSYHLRHHYMNYDLGFGVTSKFWDRIFGTELVDTSPRMKRV